MLYRMSKTKRNQFSMVLKYRMYRVFCACVLFENFKPTSYLLNIMLYTCTIKYFLLWSLCKIVYPASMLFEEPNIHAWTVFLLYTVTGSTSLFARMTLYMKPGNLSCDVKIWDVCCLFSIEILPFFIFVVWFNAAVYKTLYTYIVSEYIKIFVLGTEHDRNDQQVSHFYLFLTLIQIHFIFRDNVLYYVYTHTY